MQVVDVIGNAEGWVEDCYVSTYDLIPVDGSAFELPTSTPVGEPARRCTQRTVRGGSWKDDPKLIGVAVRAHADPAERANFRGFRIAHDCTARFFCTDTHGNLFP